MEQDLILDKQGYGEPDIESSFRRNRLGEVLYNCVVERRPKRIVEFGVYRGYSTVSMGMALRALGAGHLNAFDLFERYPYRHVHRDIAQASVDSYGLSGVVTLCQMDLYDWLKEPTEVDLLFVDVSNSGDTIRDVERAVRPQLERGAEVVFERGSRERDEIGWMVKYQKTPIRSVQKEVRYDLLTEMFPSFSVSSCRSGLIRREDGLTDKEAADV